MIHYPQSILLERKYLSVIKITIIEGINSQNSINQANIEVIREDFFENIEM